MSSKKRRNKPVKAKAPSKKIQEEKKPDLRSYLFIAVIGLITWFSFSPSLDNDFVNWDDPVYVENNPLVNSGHTDLPAIFRTPVSLNYHPLTVLTLAWNYQSSKLDARSYHLTNLLLHTANTALLFIFILLLTNGSLLMASTASLIFGIHPMHVESVAWVSERKDVLYVFFFFLGLISYLRFIKTKKNLWLIVTFLLFIASCLSKAMAVVFPILLMLIDYFKEGKLDLKKQWNKLPFFVASVIFGTAAIIIQSKGALNDLAVLTIPQRIVGGCYAACVYIIKFFVPVQLSAFYPYPGVQGQIIFPGYYYVAPIALLFIAFLLWKYRKRRFFFFGMMFFFATVILVLQFIAVGSAIVAERYSYLSYAGIAIVIADLSRKYLLQKKIFRVTEFGASCMMMVIISLLFAHSTFARCKVWSNPETLWTDVIQKYPLQVETAYRNLGNYYGSRNETEKGYAAYMNLLKMKSKDSKVYSNLGNLYAMKDNLDSSLWAYGYSIQLDSTNTDAYVNRAVTLLNIGRVQEAITDLHHSLKMPEPNPIAYKLLGSAYISASQFDNAAEVLTIYLKSFPEDGEAYYKRGIAYRQLGKESESEADLKRAGDLGVKK